MSNPFGGFVHTSPLSSLPHDATLTLASNCIRDTFGPTVQTVGDCLVTRGGASTFSQIVSSIRQKCRRVWNEERERLVASNITDSNHNNKKYKLARARGPASCGYVVEVEPIRQALLILIRHGIVDVIRSTSQQQSQQKPSPPMYCFRVHKARLLMRYPRYVEYCKRNLEKPHAALLEELLIQGRIMTVDAIVATVNRLYETNHQTAGMDASHEGQQHNAEEEKEELREAVVDGFRRLVQGGFIEQVLPLHNDAMEETEFELEAAEQQEHKIRPPRGNPKDNNGTNDNNDPAILALLAQAPYQSVLHRGTVWQVNFEMFHETFRSIALGRLVHERHGHFGAIVTAALRHVADKKHIRKEEATVEKQYEFTPAEIIEYLPHNVKQSLEKKPGGLITNVSEALTELCKVGDPKVVAEVEERIGHESGGVFGIAIRELVEFLQGRLYTQVIFDRHGEVAARICSILMDKGYLEADGIADMAMVPAKETREILHKLYRDSYVSLLTLQQGKQHNPASMIYLWTIETAKMHHVVTENVCRALTNLRLRRQHEESVGKDLLERAKEAKDMDVNEQERDKEHYERFCHGLERLDTAVLQLDETLMVLLDF